MNKSAKKVALFIGAIVLLGICYFIFSILSFYFFNRDVENIVVQGVVYDKKEDVPLKNAKVVIFSERFKSDSGNSNYDGYLGSDTVTVITDSTGYYSAKIDYSAHLQIKAFKQGYKISESDGRNAKRKITQDFYLEEGQSKESSLFKPTEITETTD